MAKQGGSKNHTSREVAVTAIFTGSATVANTTKIESSVALEEKIGMRIRAIEYFLHTGNGGIAGLLAADDELRFGLCFLSSQPTGGFLPWSPGVIDYNTLIRRDIGVAANAMMLQDPVVVKDMLKRFPEGILIHPANLYVWSYAPNQIGAPTNIYAGIKIHYTMEDINQDAWDDMWKQMFVAQAG